jgi:hypothetical protein
VRGSRVHGTRQRSIRPASISGLGWTNLSKFAAAAASTSFVTDSSNSPRPASSATTVTIRTNGKYAAVIATFR